MRRNGFCTLGLATLSIAMGFADSRRIAAGTPPPIVRPAPESARVELGRRLFFDPAASRTGTRSCADCHDPRHGYTDTQALSRDARGATPRRTQTLIDCADSPTMDWLGALDRIESVVEARLRTDLTTSRPPYYGGVSTPIDPSMPFIAPDLPDDEVPPAHDVLAAAARYRAAFAAAYPGSTVTPSRLVDAISAYLRSIASGESAYDRFAAGDDRALSTPAKRGLELFRGRAQCTNCHPMDGKRAAFTDYEFHETGLPEVPPPVQPAAPEFELATRLRVAAGRDPIGPVGTGDVVRFVRPTFLPRGGFKTPTLRDVAGRGPYMHDGSLPTLEAVVRFFLSQQMSTRHDPLMPREVIDDDGEIGDIVAFLESLSSVVRPGAPRVAWSLRASRTRLRFTDADDKPLAHWPVVLEPAGDDLPRAPAVRKMLPLVTDRDGWVAYVPPPTTHVRVVLEGGLAPEGGCWIPDTCREARLSIPIRGVGRVRTMWPAGAVVPETLELAHGDAKRFPERRLPRTVLRKESVPSAGRVPVVVYAGFIRTDVAPSATLLVPPGLRFDEMTTRTLTFDRATPVFVRF